mmetsp:Transcript_6953/g.15908  ORF Transcript_6953/g.15908 Transcript_6953/m.15908 type:complete len:90 (-) Transcript_6953:562-831(-)
MPREEDHNNFEDELIPVLLRLWTCDSSLGTVAKSQAEPIDERSTKMGETTTTNSFIPGSGTNIKTPIRCVFSSTPTSSNTERDSVDMSQ